MTYFNNLDSKCEVIVTLQRSGKLQLLIKVCVKYECLDCFCLTGHSNSP